MTNHNGDVGKMSDVGNMMRSAANELNSYILTENEKLEATIHSQMETPPDYHDQQTCQELMEGARKVDALVAQVELMKEALQKILTANRDDAGGGFLTSKEVDLSYSALKGVE